MSARLNVEKPTLDDLAEDTGSEGSHLKRCIESCECCRGRILKCKTDDVGQVEKPVAVAGAPQQQSRRNQFHVMNLLYLNKLIIICYKKK